LELSFVIKIILRKVTYSEETYSYITFQNTKLKSFGQTSTNHEYYCGQHVCIYEASAKEM